MNVVDPSLMAVAADYLLRAGLPALGEHVHVQVDPERAERIAWAYEVMPHQPEHPDVREAYAALINETLAQYQHLLDAGYTFEPWPGAGEPYANSREMLADLQMNKHLWFFRTNQGFGSEEDVLPGNPLLAPSGFTSNGQELLVNDLFRVVHDAFGHGIHGFSFGPVGEENTWVHHSGFYTPSAQRALTTETRGQNSWVNFGPLGERNRANPRQTRFAPQKTGLLPEEFCRRG